MDYASVHTNSKRALTHPGASPVPYLDATIKDAVAAAASDIHFEPFESTFRIRFRLDGVLHTVNELPVVQKDAVVSRIKVMAELDIAEKRLPQDGRIRFSAGTRQVDLRISTLPTRHGEKVVIRILDQSGAAHDLDSLGLDDRRRAVFDDAICRPHGIVLVTGPTGSGKTTTLYAALRALNTSAVNILTIEDPIEYDLPGINQSHVRSDIGYTFSKALRAFLRQDPDIIMVGEIRDAETAEMAVRASLTGHLVLSTLHTNDAPSAITRLIDMGVEPFLVASSLRLVVAQRLVRKICAECGVPIADYGLRIADLRHPPIELGAGSEGNARAQRGPEVEGHPRPNAAAAGSSTYSRQSLPLVSLADARCAQNDASSSAAPDDMCKNCYGTGYRGRTALFEMMPVSETISDLIGRRVSTSEIRETARKEGMQTLREAGMLKVAEGVTTLEEVLAAADGQ